MESFMWVLTRLAFVLTTAVVLYWSGSFAVSLARSGLSIIHRSLGTALIAVIWLIVGVLWLLATGVIPA